MSTDLVKLSQPRVNTVVSSRILLVDDEPTMRLFMQALLQKRGFAVTVATSVADAQEKILTAGDAAFEGVVTDYMMPGQNGLDLLRWLGGHDPSLAVIVVTAESERQIVAESLREGACGFLDKPVTPKIFYAAVERAIGATRHKRHQAEAAAAVKEVGRVQHMMLDADTDTRQCKPEIDTFSRPKSEAGGDFLNHFGIGQHNHFVLLTDVSGHDLKAAFISAYFQGIVRGMLESQTPVPKVFEFFNRFLLREWGSTPASSKTSGASASIAVGSVLIEPRERRATVLTSGSPLPVYVAPNGHARLLGEDGSAPLGWFPENPVQVTTLPVEAGGAFFLWTDGLEAFAEEQRISAPALATLLLLAQHGLRTVPDFSAQQDDLLVTRVALPDPTAKADGFLPLLVEEYDGGQVKDIDAMQAYWTSSLLFCLPEITPDDTFNIILAAREAMLNALEHGCANNAGKRAQFVMSFCPAKNLLRLFVSDPGPGHQFDVKEHQAVANVELIPEHRGLLMIQNLASHVLIERNGASLTLDFLLDNPLPNENA